MANVVELRPATSGLGAKVFNAVCEIEGDLRAIDELVDALTLVSETMDESIYANAVNRLAWEIKRCAQSRLRKARCRLMAALKPTKLLFVLIFSRPFVRFLHYIAPSAAHLPFSKLA